MEKIPVKDAVGMALCHDITQIVKGKCKGRAFKKGHVIREEDVPHLLKLGKESIYIWNLQAGWVHEEEAALRMAKALAGPGIQLSEPREGKVELTAAVGGLLKIDKERLVQLNLLEDIAVSSIHQNQVVKPGKKLAGTRIIPLAIRKEAVEAFEALCEGVPVVRILPIQPWKVGIIVTGSEVYHGRIQDGFGPVVRQKLTELGCSILRTEFTPDDPGITAVKIQAMIKDGAQMVALTGGMSVDPDDLTPASIREAGGKTVFYGTPVLPGSMFLLAYVGDVPVMGLPGCVMYHQTSIFDLIVPRILAGETLTKRDMAELAHGGFCLNCQVCNFPECSFGK